MKLAVPPVLVVYESPCSSRGLLFPPGPEGERAVRHGQRHPGLRLARQVQERTEEPSRLHGEVFPLENKSRAQLFVVVLIVCVCAVRIPTLEFEGSHDMRLGKSTTCACPTNLLLFCMHHGEVVYLVVVSKGRQLASCRKQPQTCGTPCDGLG